MEAKEKFNTPWDFSLSGQPHCPACQWCFLHALTWTPHPHQSFSMTASPEHIAKIPINDRMIPQFKTLQYILVPKITVINSEKTPLMQDSMTASHPNVMRMFITCVAMQHKVYCSKTAAFYDTTRQMCLTTLYQTVYSISVSAFTRQIEK